MQTCADTTKKSLTSFQRQAIESTDKWVAVVAGAGSGKTTVLINRCLNAIGGNPQNLSRVLAITFTEKAAAELLSRIRHSLPPKEHHFLAQAWVGTFHATCARILRSNAPLVDVDPSFTILDENAFHLSSNQIIRERLLRLLDEKDESALLLTEELDFKNAIALLKNLLEFRWHAGKTLPFKSNLTPREDKLHNAALNCYGLIEDALLEALKRQGALDFQELEIKTVELLKKYPAIRNSYQQRFKHILVDEYQDTSDIQSELVFLLANTRTNKLAIVGDPRQSIYRFRGANVHCFNDAVERIRKNGGEIIHLDENFRAEPALITFINSTFDVLWSEIGRKDTEPMKAARKDVKKHPAVQILSVDSDEGEKGIAQKRMKEAAALAEHIVSLTKDGRFAFKDIALLFKAMTDLAPYETAFKKAGVPYRIFGGRGLLERTEIKDMMHALNFAADPKNQVALLGLLRSPLIGLSDDECAVLAGPSGRDFLKNAVDDERTWLLRFLKNCGTLLNPSEILKEVVSATAYDMICGALDPSGGKLANLERFIALAESMEKDAPTTLSSFIEFVTLLRDRSARLGDPFALGFQGSAVSCMTVHTAKGLEFPVVAVPDLMREFASSHEPFIFLRREGVGFKLKDESRPFGERSCTQRFKHLQEIDDLEEEEELKRLLYVAMTRTRDILILPINNGTKNAGRWHEWLAPFAKNAPPNTTRHFGCNKTAGSHAKTDGFIKLEKSPTSNWVDIVRTQAAATYTVSELECFERCPQEYYLKYVMDLPAKDSYFEDYNNIAANVRGSIVHAVLQKLSTPKNTNIEETVSKECLKAGFVPTPDAVKSIKKPLEVFLRSPIAREIESGKHEARFDMKYGHAVITGTIDWLKTNPKNLEIVDFKTDAIEKKDTKKRAGEYELQLITYAIAAQTAFNLPVSFTTLYFLESDCIVNIPVDEKRLREGRERLTNIISRIETNRFALENHRPRCYKCPYHHNKMCGLEKKNHRE